MMPSGLNAPIYITWFANPGDHNGDGMADLDDIYNTRILELAAAIPHTGRLTAPGGHGEAHSKLCGSTISVDVVLNPQGTVITGFAQNVKACLLGQAAAAIVGREIIGTPVAEIHAVGGTMRRMLKENGPAPTGRWSDLALLEPVRDYRHRHASTLLIFDAIERAVADAQDRGAAHREAV
jgi:NifU-like protein involved in Fe-S cluster formation